MLVSDIDWGTAMCGHSRAERVLCVRPESHLDCFLDCSGWKLRMPEKRLAEPIWFFDPVDSGSPVPPDAAAQFAVEGYALQAWSGKPECFPGVLVVAELTERVLECLEFASDSGRLPVFVLSCGTRGRTDAVQLLRRGAMDVLPFSSPAILTIAAKCRRRSQAARQLSEQQALGRCIGTCFRWQELMMEIVEAAWKPGLPVLLTGQSGTGKEGAARLIHQVCEERRNHSFVIVDCTTLRHELSGSELFGHVRGAFTGAASDRDGALSLANQGTLFLDEIGELPLPLQAELLRVLQEKTYKPVGANFWKRTDFRLVSATNRDLMAEVSAGRFRADLYYRIAGGCHFHLPPLQERAADIPELCQHFIEEVAGSSAIPEISSEVLEYLQQRPWPGNVRELRSLLHRMLARYCGTGPLTLGTVPPADRSLVQEEADAWSAVSIVSAIESAVLSAVPLKEIGRRAEEAAIAVAVRREQGNLQKAAARLQITDRALQLRIAARRAAAVAAESGTV